MRDDLIIATYRRQAELLTCLESVARQTHMPSSITIVEGESGRPVSIPDDLKRAFGNRLSHVVIPPGLTRQRNLGVSATSGEIVHFIDDDVILHEQYFEKILESFAQDEQKSVGGVGGLITNLPSRRESLVRKATLVDGRQGSLTPSGKNILVWQADRTVEVDWLSGCGMSYRRQVFERHAFDERRPGYGWGEDVDFSTRVGLTHKLLVNPEARLEHHPSPVGRYDETASLKAELSHRHNLAKHRVGPVRTWWFWYSIAGEALLLLGLSLKTMSRDPLRRALRLIEASRAIERRVTS